MASPGFNLVRMRAPIIRPLTGVAIIMCYLAAISLASAMGVGRWANAWQAQASLKMSLYIPLLENDISIKSHDKKIKQIIILLNARAEIANATRISKQEMSKLLAPWLGKNIDLTGMPVMDLIDISLKPSIALNEKELEAAIHQILPEAELENHQQWHIAIGRWVLLMQILAGLILLASLLCMTAVISLAAHATIDANRNVVSIFHLIGAQDRFVVSVFRRYFLRLGLLAGFLGAGAAGLTFFLAQQFWQFVPEQFSISAIGVELTTIDYAALALIPALACLIAVTSSRKQALAHLRELP